jgi:hypothetical protein
MEKQMNSPIERSRNTPQLRFPEFQGEWEKKKLGEVAEIYREEHQAGQFQILEW